MRSQLLSISIFAMVVCAWYSCTPNRGCTEKTADNFDLNADEDDGTCIPAIDKMIGNYRYTRVWTDVIFEIDTFDLGNLVLTEANTADNAFSMLLNGTLPLQGSVSALDITMEQHALVDTFFGQEFTRTYTGLGTWLEADSVNFTFSLTTQVPMWDGGNPPSIIKVPQTYNYYCTKLQ